MELSRLVSGEGEVRVSMGSNHIRGSGEQTTASPRSLVDGAYPDYDRVCCPRAATSRSRVTALSSKQAFGRTAILSNEKYRGVRILLSDGAIKMVANNPEQEEAEEEVRCGVLWATS